MYSFLGAMTDYRSKNPMDFGRRADFKRDAAERVPGNSHSPATSVRDIETDTQRGMLPRALESATCVQRFDDSLNSAIRITYRISLRSSSLREPRYPLLRVVFCLIYYNISISQIFQVRDKIPPTEGSHSPQIHMFFAWHQDQSTLMILPQVHLRKPCYDFFFL